MDLPMHADATIANKPRTAELQALAEDIAHGAVEAQVLARRPGRVTVRADSTSGPVIVKLWNLSDARSTVRRLTAHTKGQAEWRSLSLLHGSATAVPEPLAFFRLTRGGPYHEALVLQDLSPCVDLMHLMHRHTKTGDVGQIRAQGDQIIQLTCALFEAELFDNDHRLANFVERPDGRIYRLDLENAWRPPLYFLQQRARASMLAALLESHIWACRFNPQLSRDFAAALFGVVKPERTLVDQIRKLTLAAVDHRRSKSNFDLPRDLGW
jgi:hypothetical protein